MKKIENREAKRLRFLELRANGETIKASSEKVGISERLGRKWERELECSSVKRNKENDLIEKYGLRRRERIERLAKTTKAVIAAAEAIDLKKLALESPSKLLELYLRFNDALSAEEMSEREVVELQSTQSVLNGIESLYNRVKCGAVSKAQAETELKVLSEALRAIESVKTVEKIAELESMITAAESAQK